MRDDRLAAAVGNASLLGIGYLLLRRWRLAIAAQLMAATLVALLLVEKALWCEIALAVWWVAVVVHGWTAAGKPGTRSVREQRLIALCVTVPVLLAGVFFRVEAAGIQSDVAEAREAGDCAGVTAAQQRARYGDRVADAPGIERLGSDVEACAELQQIKSRLQNTWSGDTEILAEEFQKLDAVLAKPGQNKTVEKVLDEYLGTVTKGGPCPTVKLATWLRNRHQNQSVLDKSRAIGDGLVPDAQFACAQSEAKAGQWRAASYRYQELIGQYPKAAVTPKARAALAVATLKVQLLDIRNLIEAGEYCDKPAAYGGAPRYRRGVNRALFLGEQEGYTSQLPSQWKTTVPTNASVAICTEAVEDGPAITTCPYVREGYDFTFYRTFRKVVVPVKIYAMRTGRLVKAAKVVIDGPSCPAVYTDDSGLLPIVGETISTPVDPTAANIRAAFQPLLVRP
ncbi:hypothetical protein GCM10029976_098020 [Kribbella albertanoniae]|uniref:Uncharacterized protein n=1 Tax=Kribbella albertanoniae TaxID=1266829 RepID=A0A4R4PKK1_9ACTN|nr:hypothetical protein [Kribbella albertanoniae]TDC22526.1 hypothetical protein E1261_30615 [Kribbella albertanoniae]